MRSSTVLFLWLCAVTCICTSPSPALAALHKSGSSHHRPRSTLLALVRAATGALHHHPPGQLSPDNSYQPLDHRYLDTLPEETLAAYPALYRRHHAVHDGTTSSSHHPNSLQQFQEDVQAQEDEATQAQQEQQQQLQDRYDQEALAEAKVLEARADAAAEAAAVGEPLDLGDPHRRVVWSKRGGGSRGQALSSGDQGSSSSSEELGEGGPPGAEEVANSVQQVEASLATNFLRHARSGGRPYDVPQIECPPADDNMERFPCPSPDRMGRYRCIDDHVLCDGFIDCPQAEDEERQQCMFYKTTKAHLDVLADAIIRWARGGK